jgi:hypothetical protein
MIVTLGMAGNVTRVLGGSIVLLSAVLLTAGAVPGRAQSDAFLASYKDGNETVTCREYGTANGTRLATYQWWLLGFVSGASHVRASMKLLVTKTTTASALGWVSNYCLAHPQDTLTLAGAALVGQPESAQPLR